MEWGPRIKLFSMILLLTLLLTILYGLSQIVVQLFHSISPSVMAWLPLSITCLLSLLILFISWERWPEWYEEEEDDILMELTVHEEPNIFRISLGLGVTLAFAVSIILQLRWPFFLGAMVAGTALWLLLVDLVMALYVYGMDGWGELFSSIAHSCLPGFWLGTLLWLIISIVASGILYHELMIPTPVPVIINTPPQTPTATTAPEPDLWQRVQNQIQQWVSNLESPAGEGSKPTPPPDTSKPTDNTTPPQKNSRTPNHDQSNSKEKPR